MTVCVLAAVTVCVPVNSRWQQQRQIPRVPPFQATLSEAVSARQHVTALNIMTRAGGACNILWGLNKLGPSSNITQHQRSAV